VSDHRITKQRRLGSTEVPPIGLGCMSLSNVYGASDDRKGIDLIRDALDLGVTLLDTSDAYGNGHNGALRSSSPPSSAISAAAAESTRTGGRKS